MHRIDGFGATLDNKFTEGNPVAAIPSTVVTADWLNAVQEEIAGVIEGAGDILDKAENTQLLAAIQSLISAAIPEIPNPFVTGDIRATLRSSAASGWVMLNDGTIGNASSGATTRANADCEDLFKLLWDNVSNTHAAVSGGRGSSAQDDWDANKTIALPKALGRVLGAAGAGSGLTSRALGETVGAETHTLTESQMPSHTHTLTGVAFAGSGPAAFASGVVSGGTSQTMSSAGGGQAHNNMQPTVFVNFEIKL